MPWELIVACWSRHGLGFGDRAPLVRLARRPCALLLFIRPPPAPLGDLMSPWCGCQALVFVSAFRSCSGWSQHSPKKCLAPCARSAENTRGSCSGFSQASLGAVVAQVAPRQFPPRRWRCRHIAGSPRVEDWPTSAACSVMWRRAPQVALGHGRSEVPIGRHRCREGRRMSLPASTASADSGRGLSHE